MPGTRKCSFCGKRRRFTIGLGNGCICYRCLERLDRFTKELGLFTDELRQPILDRRHLRRPVYVIGDRIKALASLLHEAVRKRGQIYAVSFAWRYGFTRTEVKLAVKKYGERYGWVVEKAPNNHIIVRDAASIHGPRLVEATH